MILLCARLLLMKLSFMKIVGIVVFGIVVIFIGYFLFMTSYYQRVSTLFKKYNAETVMVENPNEFNSLLLTYGDGYFAYFSNNPITETTTISDGDGLTLTIDLYATGVSANDPATKKPTKIDGIFFCLRGLSVKDIEKPSYRIKIYTEHPTFILDNNQVNYFEYVFMVDHQNFLSSLFIMPNYKDMLLIPDTEASTTITNVVISVDNKDSNGDYMYSHPILIMNNSSYPENIINDEEALFTTNFTYTHESYEFMNLLAGTKPTESEAEMYGLNITRVGKLSDYNYLIVLTMGIYAIIVAGLSYLLFFHNGLMKKLRDKKALLKAQEGVSGEEQIFYEPSEDDDKPSPVINSYEAFKAKKEKSQDSSKNDK